MPAAEIENLDGRVRAQIKAVFPMGMVMCQGSSNPLTMHASDAELFARVWSLIGETMLISGSLSRATKEELSKRVSERNACPVCVNAHTMMADAARQVAATDSDAKERKALDFLSCLQGDREKCLGEWLDLTLGEQAEVMLISLLFEHMNRSVSAVLGEALSSAMMGVPDGLAKRMEQSSMMACIMSVFAKFVGGSIKAEPSAGFTSALFDPRDDDDEGVADAVPTHLQAMARTCGRERAIALGRLYEYTAAELPARMSEVLTPPVLTLVDEVLLQDSPPQAVPVLLGPLARWITDRCDEHRLQLQTERSLATVLLLTGVAPHRLHRSAAMQQLERDVGVDRARTAVHWVSLRIAFHRAPGLAVGTDAATDLRDLSTNSA